MIHEKDKYVIPQQLESEINLAMTLQNKLLNISNETFESIYFFIRNSSFIQSNDRPRQLTNSILTAVEYRPWSIPNIALLCKKLLDQSTSTNIFLKLKSDILFKIFSQELKKQENLHFLAHCLEVNFISPQEIVEYIYQLSVDKSDKMSQLNLYFVWFAPEIEANNIVLFKTLSSIFFSKSEVPDDQKTVSFESNQNLISDAPLCCDAFYSFNQSSENNFDCGPELEDFLKNLDNYKANNWSLLKQYRLNCCNHHRINLAIKDDNIDELQQIVAEQEFDLNQTSLPSIFELSSYCQTEPTLIQFAAFYGSVECFKYLYLNGADIHKTDEEKKTTLHFAIAGGNFEIIRILNRAKFDLSNYAGVAVLYHRNDIFQWINDTFMIDVSIPDQQKELILESSCGSNNLEIFRFCMEKAIDINKKNDLGIFFYYAFYWTPLCTAIWNNRVEIVKLLLYNRDLDINGCTDQGWTGLFTAAFCGRPEIINLLKTVNNINVNCQTKNGWTPLYAAIAESNIESVQALLTIDGIDVNLPTHQGILSFFFVSIGLLCFLHVTKVKLK